MKYYHVSSYKKSGDKLDKTTKPYEKLNDFIFNLNKITCEKLLKSCDTKDFSAECAKTGRTPSKWKCEAIFELVRKEKFPDLPDRIFGTYLSEDIGSARKFNNDFRNAKARIFEVEIEEGVFKFNMSLFTMAETMFVKPNKLTDTEYMCIYNIAEKYWSQKYFTPNSCDEFLYNKSITLGIEISNIP